MVQTAQLQRNKGIEAIMLPLMELCEMSTSISAHVRTRFESKVVNGSRYHAGGISQEALANEFGIRQSAVSRIVRNVRWRAAKKE